MRKRYLELLWGLWKMSDRDSSQMPLAPQFSEPSSLFSVVKFSEPAVYVPHSQDHTGLSVPVQVGKVDKQV